MGSIRQRSKPKTGKSSSFIIQAGILNYSEQRAVYENKEQFSACDFLCKRNEGHPQNEKETKFCIEYMKILLTVIVETNFCKLC